MGISFYLYQVFNSTFNVLALICVATISYYYARNDKVDPIGNIVTSIMAFLILSDQFVMDGGKKVEGVLSLANILSSRGMIAAIIVSLVSSYIYCLFIHKKITIKMPDSVPLGVQNSFAALIPSFFILTLSIIIYAIIHVVSNGDLVDCVYHLVQVPLMNLTDSLGGVIVIGFITSLLWWFGIHGSNVVGGVMTGIWLSAVSTNLDIVKSGKALTIANGGHIVTYQFNSCFVTVTGAGITMGMVLTMLFRAKSEQYKQIGRLSIIPAIFNINEPVLFGVPIVYNPILFIPFVLVPVISSIVPFCMLVYLD
jgi:cellobiose PTS system EIIC component